MNPTIARLALALVVSLLVLPPSLGALTVTLDDNYPPYSFRDQNGNHEGILVDVWRLWSQKTGVPVTLVPQTWGLALADMKSGRADVLDTVFETPDRDALWNFTGPYAPIRTAVFHRAGLVGIVSPDDLHGYLVGIKAGDASAEALRDSATTQFKLYSSYDEVIEAAARGEIHLFVMDSPPAQHLLIAKGLSSKFHLGFTVAEDAFRRAVAKDRPDVLALVNRGFASITAQELKDIDTKWMGAAVLDPETSHFVAFLVVGALAVTGLLVLLVVFLRWQVLRRTGQLVGTEEKLRFSEEKAQALIEALPDLLFVLDATGVVVECHGPSLSTLYQDPERFLGTRLYDAFGGQFSEAVKSKLQTELGSLAVVVVELELEIRGQRRVFEARLIGLKSGRRLAIVRDLSAERRAWEGTFQRNKLESLGVLAGGLAHDFNNSLAVIQGFVSLARVQLTNPEKALASLDRAVQATRRAAGLTGQLRVLAKGSQVQPQLLSVKELAEEAASFALVGSPCLLAVDVADGPWTVLADPDQLSQVFHNLVLNAVQAMPRGGTVTLVFRREGASGIAIDVVDEGPGIEDHNLARIFDPYFTTKPSGSGLGLSVVHAVVERHGGTVTVDSRLGVGTTFTVHLVASEGNPSDSQPTEKTDEESLRGVRVLVMEDETDLRELITTVTDSLGMDTVARRNGSAGVVAFDEALAQEAPFQLVISDLLVPGDMGGRDMVAQLRARPVEFKALAVTGFSTDRLTEDFQNQGFDVILGKPFTIDELKSRIVELMKTPWKTAQKPSKSS